MERMDIDVFLLIELLYLNKIKMNQNTFNNFYIFIIIYYKGYNIYFIVYTIIII